MQKRRLIIALGVIVLLGIMWFVVGLVSPETPASGTGLTDKVPPEKPENLPYGLEDRAVPETAHEVALNQSNWDEKVETASAEGYTDQDGIAVYAGPDLMTVAANVLGIEANVLQKLFDTGQTLAQIAEIHGVDPQVLVDALVAAESTSINGLVEIGEISEAEASERIASLEADMTAAINELLADHLKGIELTAEEVTHDPDDD